MNPAREVLRNRLLRQEKMEKLSPPPSIVIPPEDWKEHAEQFLALNETLSLENGRQEAAEMFREVLDELKAWHGSRSKLIRALQ